MMQSPSDAFTITLRHTDRNVSMIFLLPHIHQQQARQNKKRVNWVKGVRQNLEKSPKITVRLGVVGKIWL